MSWHLFTFSSEQNLCLSIYFPFWSNVNEFQVSACGIMLIVIGSELNWIQILSKAVGISYRGNPTGKSEWLQNKLYK